MAFGLEGIKVIETAAVWAAPMSGRLLADWGANVIKVEHPIRGDISRTMHNASVGMFATRAARLIPSDIPYEAENHNRNKRSMTLDLSHESGREVLYRLVETADVLLANFRPREMKKFKLEYETLSQLNPRLIYANLTGYGSKGPDKDLPGYDFLTFWARSGLMHVLRKADMSPLLVPSAVGDRVVALALACGILAALFIRERTGVGQEVDVSLFNTGVYAITHDMGATLVTGQDQQQIDRKELPNVMASYFQTKDDRWLRLGMVQPDPYWSRFCRALEIEDLEHDPRFETFEPRIRNHDALFDIVEKIFLSKTLDEWKVRLNEAGLPWGPVQRPLEVIEDPQARANDFFIAYDHPTYGHIEVVANPIKLSKTPEKVRMPAPEFSQHTEEVLLEYGYTWEDIERLKEQHIIA